MTSILVALSALLCVGQASETLQATSYDFKLSTTDKGRKVIETTNYSVVKGENFKARVFLDKLNKGDLGFIMLDISTYPVECSFFLQPVRNFPVEIKSHVDTCDWPYRDIGTSSMKLGMDVRNIKEFQDQDSYLQLNCQVSSTTIKNTDFKCSKQTDDTLVNNVVNRDYFNFKRYYLETQAKLYVQVIGVWLANLGGIYTFGANDCLSFALDMTDLALANSLNKYYGLIYGYPLAGTQNKKKSVWAQTLYSTAVIGDSSVVVYHCIKNGWSPVLQWDSTNWPWKNLLNFSPTNFNYKTPTDYFYVLQVFMMAYFSFYYGEQDQVTWLVNAPRLLNSLWKGTTMSFLAVF